MASAGYKNKTELPFLFSFCLNFVINCLRMWERRRAEQREAQRRNAHIRGGFTGKKTDQFLFLTPFFKNL